MGTSRPHSIFHLPFARIFLLSARRIFPRCFIGAERQIKIMCAAQLDPKNPQRRSFFKEALSVVIGGVISVVPFAAGLTVFFDPLRRNKKNDSSAIRVASLSALPGDG